MGREGVVWLYNLPAIEGSEVRIIDSHTLLASVFIHHSYLLKQQKLEHCKPVISIWNINNDHATTLRHA